MSECSSKKNSDRVAAMRRKVSRAVGLAGLTVAVSLPAANAQTSADRDGADVANSLQRVNQAADALGSKIRVMTARGERLAWGNWQNWNNWRNY